MITHIAFANGTRNGLGPADPGITVFRKVAEGGQVLEEKEVAYWVGGEIDDEDGGLDTDAAEKQLGFLGYRVTGAGWQASGGGQMAVEVEPDASLGPVAGQEKDDD